MIGRMSDGFRWEIDIDLYSSGAIVRLSTLTVVVLPFFDWMVKIMEIFHGNCGM